MYFSLCPCNMLIIFLAKWLEVDGGWYVVFLETFPLVVLEVFAWKNEQNPMRIFCPDLASVLPSILNLKLGFWSRADAECLLQSSENWWLCSLLVLWRISRISLRSGDVINMEFGCSLLSCSSDLKFNASATHIQDKKYILLFCF